MIKQTHKIINKLGLHARAAAKFVNTANQFECAIIVSRNGRTINGKSIMGLMMLAAGLNTTVEISANGIDESEAMTALAQLIQNRFDEAE